MAASYKVVRLPPSVPAHKTLVADTSSSNWATREGLESTETVPGTAAMVGCAGDGFSLKFWNLNIIAHVTNQIGALLRMRTQKGGKGSFFAHAHTKQAETEQDGGGFHYTTQPRSSSRQWSVLHNLSGAGDQRRCGCQWRVFQDIGSSYPLIMSRFKLFSV